MTKPALDHLILFLPYNSSTKSPVTPPSFSKYFTISPGGTHAGGLSANNLILLADGCYLELICFLPHDDPSKIATHWWGPDPNRKGWTDWCLTTTVHGKEELKENDGADLRNWERVRESHEQPVKGGRKRPDGTDVRWSVTFPKGELGGQKTRGKFPFFCHDYTPRDVRVPLSASSTQHPSGVVGVKSLSVVVATQQDLDAAWKVYTRVLGVEGVKQGNEVLFEIGRVVPVEGLKTGAKVVLRLPRSGEEGKRIDERGFWYGDIVLEAFAGEEKHVGERIRVDEGDDDVQGVWIEYITRDV